MEDALDQNEEKLREAACIGDLESIKTLVEKHSVNINSQNKVNGWTALHWAAKRNHSSVVSYLLLHEADKNIKNNDNELPSQLTTTTDIKNMLGGCILETKKKELPITPNYLANPQFPYTDSVLPRQLNSIAEVPSSVMSYDNELVIKVRVANSEERDFIEVELDTNRLSFDSLLTVCCYELCIDKSNIYKIRKLPDTIVRKDKDVARLKDFQELEVVLRNKTNQHGKNSFYSSTRNDQILY